MTTTESDVLLASLDAQRAHALGAIDGLSDEQLRQAVLPSGRNCLGMIKHLALSDEHYWFRSIVGGEPLDFFPDEPGGDWKIAPSDSAGDITGLYRDEIQRSNSILRSVSMDDPPQQPDPDWAEWDVEFPTVRSIVVHVLVETACHAGHLDAARELLDGTQWLVMDQGDGDNE